MFSTIATQQAESNPAQAKRRPKSKRKVAKTRLMWFALRTVVVTTCVVLSSFHALPLSARADVALAQRFINEAPDQWKEYLRLASHLRGTVRFEQRDRKNENQVVTQWESEVVIAGPLASQIAVDNGVSRRAAIENPRYEFGLSSAKGGDWEVGRIEQGAAKQDDLIGEGQIGDLSATCKALGVTSRGLLIYVTWLPRMVEDPSFAVSDAVFVQRDGEQLVKVEFTYDPVNKDNNPVGDGTVVFDPKRFWLVREARVKGTWVDGTGTITVNNELSDEKLEFPSVFRQVMRVQARSEEGEEVDHDWVWNLDLRELGKTPDESEFTLTAYGFPEPGMRRSPGNRWLWINVGVVACLAAAFLVRQWAKSR